MDLKKFFKLVELLRKGDELSDSDATALDDMLSKRTDIQALVDKGTSLVDEVSRLEAKVTKLEEDNFKYRERARTQDQEVADEVAKATKKLQSELDKTKKELEDQAAALKEEADKAAAAKLEKDLLQAGVPEALLDKAVRLVEDSHFKEEKTKGEDGQEAVTKVFDKEKFREDNDILFVNTNRLKGIGGAGLRGKKPESTQDVADRYLSSQYSRPDKKGN